MSASHASTRPKRAVNEFTFHVATFTTRRRGRRRARPPRRACPRHSRDRDPCRHAPRAASSRTRLRRSSPGTTWRRKRACSTPPKSGSRPVYVRSASTTTPPHWAMDSRSNTPGVVGRPGKCPGKNHSSPRRVHSPLARTPGSIVSISSMKRNGGRCGSQSLGSRDSSLIAAPTPRFVVRRRRSRVETARSPRFKHVAGARRRRITEQRRRRVALYRLSAFSSTLITAPCDVKAVTSPATREPTR